MPSNDLITIRRSQTALDYITIRGFKSIAAIEKLRLLPINILIGANGSGKSNFIGAFEFLHEIREGRLQHYVTASGGAEKLLHFGSKTTREISFHLSFARGVNEYSLTLGPTGDDTLFPATEVAYFRNKAQHESPYSDGLIPQQRRLEAGISASGLTRVAQWVRERLGGWRVYHVHDTSSTSLMRKTAMAEDIDYLRSDGSNLAALLHFLKNEHPVEYSLIRGAVQRVAPFFDDFRLKARRLKREGESIRLQWSHKGSDQYFDASSLSDGTLRFIVLATLFLQPKQLRPSAIIVDEPELGLHPAAVDILASLIHRVSAETQVIVSTQSSRLLDHFDPEDVLVADRIEGATQIRRLDSKKLSVWLDRYTLGELWDKNELGGRPARG
ncbi:MAG: AAA family ATPase [Bryobacteraceae bacterium]